MIDTTRCSFFCTLINKGNKQIGLSVRWSSCKSPLDILGDALPTWHNKKLYNEHKILSILLQSLVTMVMQILTLNNLEVEEIKLTKKENQYSFV